MLQSVTYSAAVITFHTADVSLLPYYTENFFSPPVTPLPSAGLGFLILEVSGSHTHRQDPSERVISSSQRLLHTQQILVTNSHALSGIRTRDRNNQATADRTAIGIDLNLCY
jgi:hypothetical protein